MKATIFDIARGSYVDGPGIRTTVFFKGCNLRCAWCHNPEGQSPQPQLMFYKNKCTGCGKCKEKCPHTLELCDVCGKCAIYCPGDARSVCGKDYTVDEVLSIVLKDKIFYETSGGGVTFSGGECMLFPDFLGELLKKCKGLGIHTAVDTAGHLPFEAFKRVIPFTDLFLYDVKCMDSDLHKKHVGVGNELILSNLARLLDVGATVIIRVPVIAGVNDSRENMEALKAFLDSHGGHRSVELLPYHAMGEHKYAAIGKEAASFSAPANDALDELKKIFE